jgi:hypothetical protein
MAASVQENSSSHMAGSYTQSCKMVDALDVARGVQEALQQALRCILAGLSSIWLAYSPVW